LYDFGTGSGVLAIAGAIMGAREIRACDFDPHAVRIARENARRNRIPGISFVEADVLRWNPGPLADCVTANLFAEVLISVFPRMARFLKPGGVILLSGILKSQAAACLRAGRAAGFRFDLVLAKGKWVTARGRRDQAAK
jgi:ribosomal protein L11 methyltransferase